MIEHYAFDICKNTQLNFVNPKSTLMCIETHPFALQALLKLTGQLLKRDFQAMPDLTSEDGQEYR